eukprot:12357933-Alexandrium_andersonii.AAC.1
MMKRRGSFCAGPTAKPRWGSPPAAHGRPLHSGPRPRPNPFRRSRLISTRRGCSPPGAFPGRLRSKPCAHAWLGAARLCGMGAWRLCL